MSVFFPNESSIIVVLEIAVVAEAPPLLIGISKSRSIKIGRTKQKREKKKSVARATARHHVCCK